ncbi:RmlC-like cupin domain-containing protein [Phaeosphaeriaceae sp. PMI808]|nr:RmlC-like cupin domain-containing protein [Phaeosphaeriaceae sp. PMI808]
MASSIPNTSSRLQSTYAPTPGSPELPATQAVIDTLQLIKHVEGGYFAEIDRNALTIPNPFPRSNGPQTADLPVSGDSSMRNASTSIYYLLTPTMPQGHFHRNKGRTIHTLIEGRGRYVLIHSDEVGSKKRIETFLVGKNVARGEKAVWIVEGRKCKASYLLPSIDNHKDIEKDRLLISETVVPGFKYADRDFLILDKFEDLVTDKQRDELEWLVRRE